jgi:hypothetical protein
VTASWSNLASIGARRMSGLGKAARHPPIYFASGADKGAFGSNAPDDIFGGHRPPGWRVIAHGFVVPRTATAVKAGGFGGGRSHGLDQPTHDLRAAQGNAARSDVAPRNAPRRQGALSWELRAATSLARLLHNQGHPADALALLRPVYDRFTEGFDTADLQTAKVLFDALR